MNSSFPKFNLFRLLSVMHLEIIFPYKTVSKIAVDNISLAYTRPLTSRFSFKAECKKNVIFDLVQCSRLRPVRGYITFYAVILRFLGVNTRRTKGNVSRRRNITMVLFYLALPSYEWQWWGVTRVGHSCSMLIRPGGA